MTTEPEETTTEPVVTTEPEETTTEPVVTTTPEETTTEPVVTTPAPVVDVPAVPPVYVPDNTPDESDDDADDLVEIEDNEVPLADVADEDEEEESAEETTDSDEEESSENDIEAFEDADVPMGAVDANATDNPTTGVAAPMLAFVNAGTAMVIATLTRKRRD